MDDLDVIWDDAADYGAEGDVPESTPCGIAKLASLLRVYNSAMGGGLGFALEVNETFRVKSAINAMRYFELPDAANFLEDVLERSLKGEPADSWSPDGGFYDLLDDQLLRTAFEAKATEVPTDFGRE